MLGGGQQEWDSGRCTAVRGLCATVSICMRGSSDKESVPSLGPGSATSRGEWSDAALGGCSQRSACTAAPAMFH